MQAVESGHLSQQQTQTSAKSKRQSCVRCSGRARSCPSSRVGWRRNVSRGSRAYVPTSLVPAAPRCNCSSGKPVQANGRGAGPLLPLWLLQGNQHIAGSHRGLRRSANTLTDFVPAYVNLAGKGAIFHFVVATGGGSPYLPAWAFHQSMWLAILRSRNHQTRYSVRGPSGGAGAVVGDDQRACRGGCLASAHSRTWRFPRGRMVIPPSLGRSDTLRDSSWCW